MRRVDHQPERSARARAERGARMAERGAWVAQRFGCARWFAPGTELVLLDTVFGREAAALDELLELARRCRLDPSAVPVVDRALRLRTARCRLRLLRTTPTWRALPGAFFRLGRRAELRAAQVRPVVVGTLVRTTTVAADEILAAVLHPHYLADGTRAARCIVLVFWKQPPTNVRRIPIAESSLSMLPLRRRQLLRRRLIICQGAVALGFLRCRQLLR
jgi:hypothetical protein